MEKGKQLVKNFWNDASCGERLYLIGENQKEAFKNQLNSRYSLEPYILDFAEFENSKNKKMLEVGVGLGADHQKFAENGAILWGCDLTERAIEYTKQRFNLLGLNSEIVVADAEKLPYNNNFFDFVYSWGVIHHSPDTPKAVQEIYRVLKDGGEARIMIYHKNSIVGYMLWFRYALLRLKFTTSLKDIYSNYLESPGTKAYTIEEAKSIFNMFKQIDINTQLTHADLLSSDAGQRHKGFILKIARKLYPRFLVNFLFPKNGLYMMLKLKK